MKPQIIIRSMELSDLDGVLAIENQSFPTPWSRLSFISELVENSRAVYLVAEHEGSVIGYIGMWKIVDEAHITNLAVAPEFRGKGVGTALLQAATELAVASGLLRMTLEVRISNYVAQHLYFRMGFDAAGIRPRYYRDNDEDALIMWRDITEHREVGRK